MTTFTSIAIADIHVPPRLRAVEEDHARAIEKSIAAHGLLNPVTIRKTPARRGTPYTLVAGAHRLRAVELRRETAIDAVVVAADGDEATLLEIAENLFRNDLSVLDRAVFVATYREAWERKYGKVKPGNPNWDKLSQLAKNPVEALADEAEAGFSTHVAARIGVSGRTVNRLNRIAQYLRPDTRDAVRGTAVADNQTQLLKLAKMGPETQAAAAQTFRLTGDIDAAFAAAAADRRAAAPKASQELLDAADLDDLLCVWERSSAKARADFLTEIGATMAEEAGE